MYWNPCMYKLFKKELSHLDPEVQWELQKIEGYSLNEIAISPFALQKADELFITNSIVGILPITKYRKKEFNTTVASDLIGKLNAAARLT